MLGKLFANILLLSAVILVHGEGEELVGKPNVVVRDILMHMKVQEDGEMTSEDIQLNYAENYVRVSTPGSNGAPPSVFIHDYGESLSLFKNNDSCFVIMGFKGIPENLKDWEKIQDSESGEVINVSSEDQKNYLLDEMALWTDPSSLPIVMQNECSGEINIAEAKEVSEPPEEAELAGELVEAMTDVDEREKRRLFRRLRRRIKRWWVRRFCRRRPRICNWLKTKGIKLGKQIIQKYLAKNGIPG